MARCQATTKTGKACRAPATAGGLCFLHANPSQAPELGRIGGRKNRQPTPGLPTAAKMTLRELSEVLVETLRGVQSKKLSPRRASAVVQLCTALRQTLPAADLESRVTRLEEQVAEQAVATAASNPGTETIEQKASAPETQVAGPQEAEKLQ